MHVRTSIRTKRILFCGAAALLCFIYLYSTRNSYTSLANGERISLKLLLAGAIKAAEIGGAEIISVHDGFKLDVESKGKTKEGINDPVTAADYRSHCAMYHSLKQAFPGVAVISEEASKGCDRVSIPDLRSITDMVNFYKTGNDETVNIKDVTVWIDPLDATKEFTENLLKYVTTMVCVAVKGIPVIGVIYKPFELKPNCSLYWTWTKHGESSNLQNIPKQESDKMPTLIVSRSHAGHVYNISKIAFGENIQIVSAAGAGKIRARACGVYIYIYIYIYIICFKLLGYKFLEVATGNVTAYVHVTAIKKWDICAGAAILSALGGTITTLDDRSINFGPTDNKLLNSGLLATISDHKWYLDKFSNV
ncbi:putative inositol monophosphatase 3 isoform X1 [Prorops nasuta]|uniref:putative inositol monophosphatase 3 isoform X1 n=1 Tax=Prorops nasuta TaxID=863751 RepID=UPI0034CDADC6